MVISRKDVIMQILSIPVSCRKNREKDVAVLDSLLTFAQKLMQRSLYWPYLNTLSQSLLIPKKSLAFTMFSQFSKFVFSMHMLIAICNQLTVLSKNSSLLLHAIPHIWEGFSLIQERYHTVLKAFAMMPAEHNQESKQKSFSFSFHFSLFSKSLLFFKPGYCRFHSAWNKLTAACLCG